MKKTIGCCLVAALLFAIPAPAQTMQDKSAAQLKMLLQFKGHWEAKAAVLHSNDKEYSFAYYADFNLVADNSGLLMTESATIPTIGKLKGSNLMGVSPSDGKVHWFSVDNLGTTHEHIGEFADSQHFSMSYTGMQEGKQYTETISIEITGAGQMKLTEDVSMDGNRQFLVTAMFQRMK